MGSTRPGQFEKYMSQTSQYIYLEGGEFKVTPHDENHDFIIFYIFIDSYCVTKDLWNAKGFMLKYY